MIDDFDIWSTLLILFFFAGPILLPIGLGVITHKMELSLALRAVSIVIGLILGPGILAFIWRVSLPTAKWVLLGGSSGALGYLFLIIGIFLRKRVEADTDGVTLVMPLPPGTRDWGDKR